MHICAHQITSWAVFQREGPNCAVLCAVFRGVFFHIFYLHNMMLYQNCKILYFNKTSYLKYLQCLLIVLKYDQKFNFVQEIKLQYIEKKKWQASTTIHDLFVNNLKISPTFICRGEVPSHTFAKLPVHVLINDPKKLDPKSSLQLQTHHLVMWPTSTSRSKHFCTFSKFPLSALINGPQKRGQHQLGPMTHFLTTSTFDLLLYIEEKCLQTHLQSFLCVS